MTYPSDLVIRHLITTMVAKTATSIKTSMMMENPSDVVLTWMGSPLTRLKANHGRA
eukprot:CAMPEP_0179185630 /NCGR_PEP_ID=MMETSP0796-20121207/92052_1 /TAXON_ID=73915 /ORGANISM="Pyrodinium bahamense, Strain pbaha01" /LENGTH=55 /DNA_ID=CAMNT_0020889593 /DNA_START=234 /DNA_END=398 /DNA_ORIENTATION=+